MYDAGIMNITNIDISEVVIHEGVYHGGVSLQRQEVINHEALPLLIRAADGERVVFGGPSMGRRAFVEGAGAAAEGVLLPLALEESDLAAEFGERFEARWSVAPDYAAYHAYDSTRLLVAAIRRAGLNREQIRAALAELGHELSEGLRELKEELRDGAKHIREAVRRELRNL